MSLIEIAYIDYTCIYINKEIIFSIIKFIKHLSKINKCIT